MKAETLEGLREYAFREGSDEDPLSIDVGALIQAYDHLQAELTTTKARLDGTVSAIPTLVANARQDERESCAQACERWGQNLLDAQKTGTSYLASETSKMIATMLRGCEGRDDGRGV